MEKGKGFALSENSLQKTLAQEFTDLQIWTASKDGDYKPLAKSFIKVGERFL